MPKMFLLLATQKGYTALKYLAENNLSKYVKFVVTFREIGTSQDWSTLIIEECNKIGIPCYIWSDVKNSVSELAIQYEVDSAVAISWRYFLPLSLNKILKTPLIIFHDSLLPRYRGFAPTPTAIMAGEKFIGVTAFFASDEVDAGDIILQNKMNVSRDMYIKDIIAEQSKIYAEMLAEIILSIKDGTLNSVPQNEHEATYSIWRNEDDCQINWTKTSEEIYNFVRALGDPYPNAFTYCNNRKIDILKVEVVQEKLFVVRDCGKIWSIKNNQPEIICGAGMIKILSAVDSSGKIFKFEKLRCRLGEINPSIIFVLNGNADL